MRTVPWLGTVVGVCLSLGCAVFPVQPPAAKPAGGIGAAGDPVGPALPPPGTDHPLAPYGCLDISPVIGLTTSAGRYIDAGQNKAWVADVHAEFVLFNASAEHVFTKDATDAQNRFYLGWGAFQVFQVQRGWGDGGNSWRLRSDLAFPTCLYPARSRTPAGTGARLAPVLSLAVDYMDGYKRYGVLMGVVW